MQRLTEEVKSLIRTGVALPSVTQVVEELLLNSIDAGASNIAVRVDLSCFKIQVVDNGHGITSDQFEMIGERYATSKCHSAEDLEILKHYGYRGEALASIKDSSSFLEIVSRAKGSCVTFSKCFQRGKQSRVSKLSTCRPSVGTTITVHDLFYNLPVRQSKSNLAIEMEKIRYRVASLALMWPKITISLRNDAVGQVLLQTKKSSNTVGVFCSLFPATRPNDIIEMNAEKNDLSIWGFVSKECHSQKDIQFVYINKRLVVNSCVHKCVNRILSHSLITKRREQSGTDMSSSGSPSKHVDLYGMFVINVTCPFNFYDITFDPKKTLVEFRDYKKLSDLIQDMIYGQLRKENLLCDEYMSLKTQRDIASEISQPRQPGVGQYEVNRVAGTSASDVLISEPVEKCRKDLLRCLDNSGDVNNKDEDVSGGSQENPKKSAVLEVGYNDERLVESVSVSNEGNTPRISHDKTFQEHSDTRVEIPSSSHHKKIPSEISEKCVEKTIRLSKHNPKRLGRNKPELSKISMDKSVKLVSTLSCLRGFTASKRISTSNRVDAVVSKMGPKNPVTLSEDSGNVNMINTLTELKKMTEPTEKSSKVPIVHTLSELKKATEPPESTNTLPIVHTLTELKKTAQTFQEHSDTRVEIPISSHHKKISSEISENCVEKTVILSKHEPKRSGRNKPELSKISMDKSVEYVSTLSCLQEFTASKRNIGTSNHVDTVVSKMEPKNPVKPSEDAGNVNMINTLTELKKMTEPTEKSSTVPIVHTLLELKKATEPPERTNTLPIVHTLTELKKTAQPKENSGNVLNMSTSTGQERNAPNQEVAKSLINIKTVPMIHTLTELKKSSQSSSADDIIFRTLCNPDPNSMDNDFPLKSLNQNICHKRQECFMSSESCDLHIQVRKTLSNENFAVNGDASNHEANDDAATLSSGAVMDKLESTGRKFRDNEMVNSSSNSKVSFLDNYYGQNSGTPSELPVNCVFHRSEASVIFSECRESNVESTLCSHNAPESDKLMSRNGKVTESLSGISLLSVSSNESHKDVTNKSVPPPDPSKMFDASGMGRIHSPPTMDTDNDSVCQTKSILVNAHRTSNVGDNFRKNEVDNPNTELSEYPSSITDYVDSCSPQWLSEQEASMSLLPLVTVQERKRMMRSETDEEKMTGPCDFKEKDNLGIVLKGSFNVKPVLGGKTIQLADSPFLEIGKQLLQSGVGKHFSFDISLKIHPKSSAAGSRKRKLMCGFELSTHNFSPKKFHCRIFEDDLGVLKDNLFSHPSLLKQFFRPYLYRPPIGLVKRNPSIHTMSSTEESDTQSITLQMFKSTTTTTTSTSTTTAPTSLMSISPFIKTTFLAQCVSIPSKQNSNEECIMDLNEVEDEREEGTVTDVEMNGDIFCSQTEQCGLKTRDYTFECENEKYTSKLEVRIRKDGDPSWHLGTEMDRVSTFPIQPVLSITSQHTLAIASPSQHTLPIASPSQHTLPITSPSQHTLPMTSPSQHTLPMTSPSQHTPPIASPSRHTLPITSPNQHILPIVSPSWQANLPQTREKLPSEGGLAADVGASFSIDNWKNPVFRKYEMPCSACQTCPTEASVAKACYAFINGLEFTGGMLQNASVIGQVEMKFIACIIGKGSQPNHPDQKQTMLTLFDQHAVHERIRLEALTRGAEETGTEEDNSNKRLKRAKVNPPVTLTISEDDARIVKAFQADFQRIGVDFALGEPVQATQPIIIHSLPLCMTQRDGDGKQRDEEEMTRNAKDLIQDHIQHLKATNGVHRKLPLSVHRVLCSQACRGAIKFGDPVSVATCKELMKQLSECCLPFQCAHGRPSIMPLVNLTSLEMHSHQTVVKPRLGKLSHLVKRD